MSNIEIGFTMQHNANQRELSSLQKHVQDFRCYLPAHENGKMDQSSLGHTHSVT